MPEITYLEHPTETDALMDKLCPPVRNWFREKFPDFTRPQKLAIPTIMDGGHLLLCSPTGSGKTLTAFSHDYRSTGSKSVGWETRKKNSLCLHLTNQSACKRHPEKPHRSII